MRKHLEANRKDKDGERLGGREGPAGVGACVLSGACDGLSAAAPQ